MQLQQLSKAKHRAHPSEPHLPALPAAEVAQVWIDFDGTITQKDVLDELIQKFAVDKSWREIEKEWSAGLIGSHDCLRREFDLVRIERDNLSAFLKTIPVDPGLSSLFSALRRHHVPFAILSDGIETFIQTILAAQGEHHLTIRSNRIEHAGDRLSLVCPHRHSACSSNAAHCKCESARALGNIGGVDRVTIYIGDGRSDLCPARKAEIVFAKRGSALTRLLAAEGKPFIEFATLADIAQILAQAWVPEVAPK